MKELEGKTAFVTGASRGLGESIALELVKRGVYVIGVSRSGPSESLQKYIEAGRASYQRADLSIDWEKVIEKVYAEFGGFEIFVNNAGTLSVDYFLRANTQRIADEIHLDLTVPILMHKHWLALYDQQHPSVKKPELSINLCSISSLQSWPGGTIYQASKTGLAAFVYGFRAMQQYLREKADRKTKEILGPSADLNIRVAAIYPDSVATGMIAKAEAESLYKIRGDFLPPDIVIDVIMKTIEGAGNFGKFNDIAILANPTHPKTGKPLKGVYAAFLPEDAATQRPDFGNRILERIAGTERLIKR